MTAPAVIFDLDGTLVDTTYLHTFAWFRALDEAGERRTMAAIHPLIGMGSTELLTALLGRDDEAISEAHGERFAELHRYVRPLPGARRLVRHVKAEGGRVVIASSAKPRDLGALMGALDCDGTVDELVHGEDTERAKPAPDIFAVALERAGNDPQGALVVGDSVWDVESAAKLGLGCVAVGTGGIDLRRLEEAGALRAYESCAAVLESWPASPLARLLDAAAAG